MSLEGLTYRDMMIHCYQHVLDSVENVCSLVGGQGNVSFHLNKLQCQVLVEELVQTKAFLQERSDCSKFVEGAGCVIFQHLCLTVKRAEVLVSKCCCKSSEAWLVVAMMLVEIQEECIAIILDLHLWRMLFDLAIITGRGLSMESKVEELKILDEKYHRLSNDLRLEGHALQQAAISDKKATILNSSRIAKIHGSSNGVDYLRSIYLQALLSCDTVREDVELTKWEYVGLLGRGGCGIVNKVKWLGFECALKMLDGQDEKEASALKGLFHPNVIRLLHYWEDCPEEPQSRLLMELMPKDLRGYIKDRMRTISSSKSQEGMDSMPFSLPVAIDIMYHIARAMCYMHDQCLAHRDLKPSNILVKERLTCNDSLGYLDIKLADFGLVKAYSNTSTFQAHSGSKGTTHYRAPEMFGKDMSQTIHYLQMADVWSFGITCSEILSGKEAYAKYASEYSAAIQSKICKEGLRPTLPKNCPEFLSFCIESCWEYLPTRRPTFASLCKLLRYAKLLSLGVTHLDDSKVFFAYLTRSGQVKSLNLSSRPSIATTVNADIIDNSDQSFKPTLNHRESNQHTQASLVSGTSPLDVLNPILHANIAQEKVGIERTMLKTREDGVVNPRENLRKQHFGKKNIKCGILHSIFQNWFKRRSAERELLCSNEVVATSHLPKPPAGPFQLATRTGLSLEDDASKTLQMALSGVKSAINLFAKLLISKMEGNPVKYGYMTVMIFEEIGPDFNSARRAHHRPWFVRYRMLLVQAFICKRLFDGFNAPNGYFSLEFFENDPLPVTRLSSFADFSKFQDRRATISMLLDSDSPDGSFLGRYCFNKFVSIADKLSWSKSRSVFRKEWASVEKGCHPKTVFYKRFLNVAVSVWLLHRLVHSFEETLEMLIYEKGSKFQSRTMEAVVPESFEGEDEEPDANSEVSFSVTPGFQVSGSVVVKCEVYLCRT